MNDIMNENQLTVVKNFEFDKPLIQRTDSVMDNCSRDSHNKFFHIIKTYCINFVDITSITNNEIINLTISDKSMNLYKINKNLKVAWQKSFIFNQKKTNNKNL